MAAIVPRIINTAVDEIKLYNRVVSHNLFMKITRILLLKIINQSMENINKLIEKNT